MLGLTIGTFDCPHMGHAALLRKASDLCHPLRVGVNSDAFVTTYKGKPPLFTEQERRALISELGYLTYLNDGPGAELISEVMPDILIVGSDWLDRDYCAQIGMPAQELADLGIICAFVPYTANISTSIIKARL